MRERKTTSEIIPDPRIEFVHANANFGDMSKREVVDEGVLKCAFGFSHGNTQMCILLEHGLARKRSEHSYYMILTAKGRQYFQALGYDVMEAFGKRGTHP